jgi:hypothetical protein
MRGRPLGVSDGSHNAIQTGPELDHMTDHELIEYIAMTQAQLNEMDSHDVS